MASNSPEGITLKSLALRDKKEALKACQHLADQLEKEIDSEELATHADKYYRCKICNSLTKDLKTTDGDPEGIRHDRICTNPKCKRKHGMTKAHFFAFPMEKKYRKHRCGRRGEAHSPGWLWCPGCDTVYEDKPQPRAKKGKKKS